MFIRTGNGGSNANYILADLGYIIQTGAAWKPLLSGTTSYPNGGGGNFTAIQLRDSRSLYNAVRDGYAEYSLDGYTQNAAIDYDADAPFVRNLINNNMDLSLGKLVLPTTSTLPSSNVKNGEIMFHSDGYANVYNSATTTWAPLLPANPNTVLSSANTTFTGVNTFNPSTSTAPALVITPDTVTPTTGLVDGAVTIVGGLMYNYDATRGKFLSGTRQNVQFGSSGILGNLYLGLAGTITSATPFRVVRNGTITAMTMQGAASQTWTLEIYRSGTVIASLTTTSATGNQNAALNVDVAVGDQLSFFCNGLLINSPSGMLEIAWRV